MVLGVGEAHLMWAFYPDPMAWLSQLHQSKAYGGCTLGRVGLFLHIREAAPVTFHRRQ